MSCCDTAGYSLARLNTVKPSAVFSAVTLKHCAMATWLNEAPLKSSSVHSAHRLDLVARSHQDHDGTLFWNVVPSSVEIPCASPPSALLKWMDDRLIRITNRTAESCWITAHPPLQSFLFSQSFHAWGEIWCLHFRAAVLTQYIKR